MRPKAAAFLRSLPDLTALRKDVLARRSKVQRLMAGRPQAVGWLARETDGWRVRTGAVLPAAGHPPHRDGRRRRATGPGRRSAPSTRAGRD